MILRSRRIVTPAGLVDGHLEIEAGRIAAIAPGDRDGAIDVGEAALFPGVVDSHVHLNEPGRTEWEGFETATHAAAAGGITTVVDMPLNCIPVTTSLDALERKREAVAPHAFVDYAFWGGVVPGNERELAAMARAGVAGCKAFLTHSGIDDFPNVTPEDLRRAMPVLAECGLPLLAHAELDGPANPNNPNSVPDPRAYATYLASRPPSMEVEAIRALIALCRETGCDTHIVHLSAADALEDARRARSEGLPLSLETCPHYLLLEAESIREGRTELKCAPPIREASNRERLWDALLRGDIDFVVSDHSPCTPALKASGDFMEAWGGISSLQLGLSLVYTEASRRGVSLVRLAKMLCDAPARLAGLSHRKGALVVGRDADIVVLEPESRFVVEPNALYHRHKVTPYLGRELQGRVRATYLRGKKIYEDGTFFGAPSGAEPPRS